MRTVVSGRARVRPDCFHVVNRGTAGPAGQFMPVARCQLQQCSGPTIATRAHARDVSTIHFSTLPRRKE